MVCQLNWKLSSDDQELALRLRPIREQWEARGAGLLSFTQRQRSWLQLPKQVDVFLVAPTSGAGGRILSPHELEFAGVLANPHSVLPEVVRLGWLCLGLTVDNVRERVGLIPVIVEAAEYVELAQLNELSLECAVQNWQTENEISGRQLFEWWHDRGCRAVSRPDWETAIEEL